MHYQLKQKMDEKTKEKVEKVINSDRIFVMMKGTPEQLMCGFSARIVHVLKDLKVRFAFFNIFDDHELMQQIKDYSDWPTTPQIYVEGKLIGGCDIIEQLYKSGKLKEILKSYNYLN